MQASDRKPRPKLSPAEQVEHLKKKGVKFSLTSEEEAKQYLTKNNNYFKLRAYRKSFEKYSGGEKDDTYINLDFAMLKDLAIIDMRIRYMILPLALDIEHFEKVKLLKYIAESEDDGYNIVKEYIRHLQQIDSEDIRKHEYSLLMNEIQRNKSSEYCGGIIAKYDGEYPVWAFVEIIPFGSFLNFLRFCADYFDDKDLKDDFYLLSDVKRLRNAAAHNSCVIHDLSLNTSHHDTNYQVLRFLGKETDIPKHKRDKRMSNAAINDIVTLLYAHIKIVTSKGVKDAQNKKVHEVIERCFKHIDYYRNNELIPATFNFLKKVVDKMYPFVV